VERGKHDVTVSRLLLDTHTLLWWSATPQALSRRVKHLIEDEGVDVFVSAASAWEITTKVRLGKLKWTSPPTIEAYCIAQGFELMPVLVAHAERAGSWPQPHGDPFDRMLAAQSALEGIPLATDDPKIDLFDVETIW
jgi:PIN domain nuclease of toxin-antitoxin system